MNIGFIVEYDKDVYILQKVMKVNNSYEILDSNDLLDIKLKNEYDLDINIGDMIIYNKSGIITGCFSDDYFYILNNKSENKTKKEINFINSIM